MYDSNLKFHTTTGIKRVDSEKRNHDMGAFRLRAKYRELSEEEYFRTIHVNDGL